MKLFFALLTSVLIMVSLIRVNWIQTSVINTAGELNLYKLRNKYSQIDTIKPIRTNLGNPYITNYNLTNNEQQIWSISQDAYGQMIFAHREGLTIFDGNNWEQVKLPAIPFIVKPLPERDILLIGCDNQYGYIQLNDKGIYEYSKISKENVRPGEITDIKLTNSNIYFYSEESLSIYDRETLKLKNELFVNDGIKQSGIIQFKDNIYISKENKGLYKVATDGQKKYINRSKKISNHQLAFSIPFSKKGLLLGTFGNKLYTFNGKSLKEYNGPANKYINESQLVGGISLNNEQFALSTLSGGVIIINKSDEQIIHVVDYQNGLPDDEIFAAGIDNQGGLWVSHGFGISRVNYELPVKDFNYYPGIEGKLIDVIDYNNTTYIATTEGVFYLDTLANVKEYDVYTKKYTLKKRKKQKKESHKTEEEENVKKPEQKETKTIITDKEEKPKKKKSFLQRWKERREKRRAEKKRKNKIITIEDDEKPVEKEQKKSVDVEKKTEVKKNTKEQKYWKVRYKKEKIKELTLSYVFKKVKDITGKCKQLIRYDNSILVATNNGLYEIKEEKAKKIIKDVYVNTIAHSKTEGLFYIGTDRGLIAIKNSKKHWKHYDEIQPKDFDEEVTSIVEDDNQDLWIGSDALIYHFDIDKEYKASSFEIYDFGVNYPDKFSIRKIGREIFFLSSRQVYIYNHDLNKIEPSDQLISEILPFYKFIISQSDITWLMGKDKWMYVSDRYELDSKQTLLLNLFENIQNIRVDEDNNLWVVDGNNQLFKILPSGIPESFMADFDVFIQRIQNDLGDYVSINNIDIEPEINSLTFKISAPFYLRPDGIRYQYFIKGAMYDWSDWRQSSDFDILLQPGAYSIHVKAKNIFGKTVRSSEYTINVKSPIWLKTWFIITCTAVIILILALLVFVFQKKKEKRLQRYNKLLETKVEERTLKIKKQKEQIEYKNREITESINYASQIQSAILPPVKIIDETVEEFFILNKPKDIVSGDYYWANRINGQLVVTAADCTGHGVPGAFLSMLGVTFLNEITSKMEFLKASVILEKLRDRVINSLHQEGFDKKRLDGIDLSLVVLDLDTYKIQFSGANNPMYLLRNGKLTEFKGDRIPIGIHAYKDYSFSNHEIETKKGDLIYLFSDGYIDQFGGKHGRKFLSRNFKVLLSEISGLPLDEQKTILNETFEMWKGNHPQIDDILIVGLKL